METQVLPFPGGQLKGLGNSSLDPLIFRACGRELSNFRMLELMGTRETQLKGESRGSEAQGALPGGRPPEVSCWEQEEDRMGSGRGESPVQPSLGLSSYMR